MKKLLIITTPQDLSLPLFLAPSIKNKINIDISFYDQKLDKNKKYDYIYFRDPFNGDDFDLGKIEQKVEKVIMNNKNSYIVDKISSFKDILFEDKWMQYQAFAEFMPKTKLLETKAEINNNYFIKKRISSRSRGLITDPQNLKGDESSYIKQEKLSIKKEYRVYVIFKEIIKITTLKTPKTENNKVKVYGSEEVSPKLSEFVQKITDNLKFDFIGLDIADTDSGYFLIEINRSCLFNKFFDFTGINLADNFIGNLLKQ